MAIIVMDKENSITLTVPQEVAAGGRKVEVKVEGGRLVISGLRQRPRPVSWAEVHAKNNLSEPYDEEMQAWINAPLVGLEIPRDN